jgi:hypothetical protein
VPAAPYNISFFRFALDGTETLIVIAPLPAEKTVEGAIASAEALLASDQCPAGVAGYRIDDVVTGTLFVKRFTGDSRPPDSPLGKR